MPTHPNRSKRDPNRPGRTPSKEEIAAARAAAGLTVKAAAELIYCTENGWQQWEAGERRMHPAFFELFKIKAAERERGR